TSGMGLVLGGRGPVVLTGHADTSWVDDLAMQRSSQGYTFSLGSSSVSWPSTRSSSVLSSSCEAKIYTRAMAAQELRCLTYLLTNLGERPCSSPGLYVDNKAMIALCQEHRLEHRTKHITLHYFLARELQQRGQLRLAYVATRANTTDIFTKALQSGDHQRFCTVSGLVPTLPHLLTADHFLSLDPTSLTVDLLEQHLLAAETSAVAVGAARGTPRPPFFEGCSPSLLAPSCVCAAAADISISKDVGAASASAKHRTSKGKGGRGGGGGNGGGGGGSGSGGGGSSGGGEGSGCGGGGGTGGGSEGSGGGGGGSGGRGGSGGSGTGGGRTGPRRGGPGGGQPPSPLCCAAPPGAEPHHPAEPHRPTEPRRPAELRRPTEPCRPAKPRRPTEPHCPACAAPAATAASAATAATTAPAATAAMASPTVLTFDAEGRAVDFDVWVDDLHLFLQCDSRDGVSLFDHTSSVSTAPAATADSTVRPLWTTRDAVAYLAVRSHLPSAERAHFGQYKTAQSCMTLS
ncbi:unnamed protein product, partial [Closterium sp. NIES-53]